MKRVSALVAAFYISAALSQASAGTMVYRVDFGGVSSTGHSLHVEGTVTFDDALSAITTSSWRSAHRPDALLANSFWTNPSNDRSKIEPLI